MTTGMNGLIAFSFFLAFRMVARVKTVLALFLAIIKD